MTNINKEKDVNINHRYEEVIFNDEWKEAYGEKYWEYRRMWSEVPQNRITTPFPMHLDIEVTNYCNLLCPMCPRTLRIQRGEKVQSYYTDFKVFKRAIDMGKEKGLYAININAAGEPLFHPKLVQVVEYAKENGVLDVMFHTNATLLTEEISEALIKAGLDKLIVSFDSPNKEHYEEIRKGASFDEVVENVKRFVEIKRRLNRKLPIVRINMVIMKENEHEKEAMINFWKDYVNSIGFLGCINPAGLDNETRNIGKVEYNNEFVCEKLWQRLTIGYNGDIRMCHMDEIGYEVLGNIFENDIANIWNEEQMDTYRRLHLEGKINQISACKICGMPEVE